MVKLEVVLRHNAYAVGIALCVAGVDPSAMQVLQRYGEVARHVVEGVGKEIVTTRVLCVGECAVVLLEVYLGVASRQPELVWHDVELCCRLPTPHGQEHHTVWLGRAG